MVEIKVVNLSESQIEDAGRALALAFQSDPLQTYMFPDARERAERSPGHFAALLRYGHLFGQVFTNNGSTRRKVGRHSSNALPCCATSRPHRSLTLRIF